MGLSAAVDLYYAPAAVRPEERDCHRTTALSASPESNSTLPAHISEAAEPTAQMIAVAAGQQEQRTSQQPQGQKPVQAQKKLQHEPLTQRVSSTQCCQATARTSPAAGYTKRLLVAVQQITQQQPQDQQMRTLQLDKNQKDQQQPRTLQCLAHSRGPAPLWYS